MSTINPIYVMGALLTLKLYSYKMETGVFLEYSSVNTWTIFLNCIIQNYIFILHRHFDIIGHSVIAISRISDFEIRHIRVSSFDINGVSSLKTNVDFCFDINGHSSFETKEFSNFDINGVSSYQTNGVSRFGINRNYCALTWKICGQTGFKVWILWLEIDN